MVITLVMDQYGMLNNGTTATARHFAEKMRERGHTVRIVTCIPNVSEPDIYLVKERKIPFFTRLIHSHGMVLASGDEKVLTDAIRGADVVHFFLPFQLARAGKKIADRLGVPSVAAFHAQPENITYNIKVERFGINRILYAAWRRFFNRFSHIHVPSEMMKSLLLKHGYQSEIHAISNGVHPVFAKRDAARPSEFEGKYLITMSGRLAREKRQADIIRAAGKSKYNDRIQLVFCGKGPLEGRLKRLGAKLLKNQPVIKFCGRDALIDTLNYCDLYVHASEIESEAIACMEAFSCGKVPIISDAKYSATKQFALSPHSLYKNRDSSDLAAKIDWMIEHPEEKARLERAYLEFAEKFRLDVCVPQLENVFMRAIRECADARKPYYVPEELYAQESYGASEFSDESELLDADEAVGYAGN